MDKILPFVGVLLAIALFPSWIPQFWNSNRNKAWVMLAFSLPVLLELIPAHPSLLGHAMGEWVSFICMIGSLFVVSGGISLTGDLRATPKNNLLFLSLGAVLANFIGTTGASILLIRPLLKTNSERKNVAHLPIFFIFIVGNCAGLLTPLGDPPLFMGFLQGVPFFWTLRLFPIWLLGVSFLLALFFFLDTRAYGRESAWALRKDAADVRTLQVQGGVNFLFLTGIMIAVFLPTILREIVMISMALLSLWLGSRSARHHNQFHWHPLVEIATLFLGIFITMIPALSFLSAHAPSFGFTKPWHFFWGTGLLSGFLDNAPTYLAFLSVAQGSGLAQEVLGVPTRVLEAISVGAVFMGANTYIGNGPNLMIKSICDHHGIKTPSFLGYMAYSAAILLPLYVLIHFLFFP